MSRHRWPRLPARLRWHRPGRRIPEDPAAQRRLVPDRPARLAAVGGIVVASILTFAFGSIESTFWPVAGSMALGIAALALPLAGLQKAFGAKGFTIGAMAMMFLGNPLAGIATTSAWLPSGLGTFGQILPPGAAGTLVRSAAYFDGAGGLVALSTLVTWIVVGLLLYAVGMRRAVGEEAAERPSAQVTA
ncbi:hypothetical protein RCF27_05640 [Rhodococcus pyridinivorans]|uniref:hypothetical protein n=1 Tax=Rhodococcus pyridinivorans TaxID=103816 RepID=UPI001D1343CF|nr:hypothetical protein [Rhodococcus pyridinivorans]WMM73793.1 hypothetical protein RCF27_05640 [Rhodococcus pyridinivorans]